MTKFKAVTFVSGRQIGWMERNSRSLRFHGTPGQVAPAGMTKFKTVTFVSGRRIGCPAVTATLELKGFWRFPHSGTKEALALPALKRVIRVETLSQSAEALLPPHKCGGSHPRLLAASDF
jgi:hypothetical protein